MTQLTCFKAYDIRGELGEELTGHRLPYGQRLRRISKPGKIVVGDGLAVAELGSRGLTDAGTDVLDIGLSDTEIASRFHLRTDAYRGDGEP